MAEIATWLSNEGLGQQGLEIGLSRLGIESLADLSHADETDIRDMAKELQLRMGTKLKFIRAIRDLHQSTMPAPGRNSGSIGGSAQQQSAARGQDEVLAIAINSEEVAAIENLVAFINEAQEDITGLDVLKDDLLLKADEASAKIKSTIQDLTTFLCDRQNQLLRDLDRIKQDRLKQIAHKRDTAVSEMKEYLGCKERCEEALKNKGFDQLARRRQTILRNINAISAKRQSGECYQAISLPVDVTAFHFSYPKTGPEDLANGITDLGYVGGRRPCPPVVDKAQAGDSTIKIVWSPAPEDRPTTKGGDEGEKKEALDFPIVKYKIQVGKGAGPSAKLWAGSNRIEAFSDKNEITLHGFGADSVYSIRIQAQNAIGWSSFCSTIPLRTLPIKFTKDVWQARRGEKNFAILNRGVTLVKKEANDNPRTMRCSKAYADGTLRFRIHIDEIDGLAESGIGLVTGDYGRWDRSMIHSKGAVFYSCTGELRIDGMEIASNTKFCPFGQGDIITWHVDLDANRLDVVVNGTQKCSLHWLSRKRQVLDSKLVYIGASMRSKNCCYTLLTDQ